MMSFRCRCYQFRTILTQTPPARYGHSLLLATVRPFYLRVLPLAPTCSLVTLTGSSRIGRQTSSESFASFLEATRTDAGSRSLLNRRLSLQYVWEPQRLASHHERRCRRRSTSPDVSVSIVIETIFWFFCRADPSTPNDLKGRYFLRGVKEEPYSKIMGFT